MNHYGFNQSDNVPVLKAFQLTSLLHDIYFAADKCDYFAQSVDFNLDRCTAILANFFWSVFDPYVLNILSILCFFMVKSFVLYVIFGYSRNRNGSISLLEFKQLMLLLCNTQHFEQFATDEFTIACDHNRCVNRFRFESILKVISKLFSYLEENAYYRSQAINDIVHECFEQVRFSCLFIRFSALFLGRISSSQ